MSAAAGTLPERGEGTAHLLRIAATCGLAAQIGFTILWIVWGFVESDYDWLRQDVSDFGALDASHPLPYNVVLSLTGALTVPLAFGLWRALKPGALAIAGSIAVGVFGIGEFIDGLAREDCAPSRNAACRAAVDAGDVSWHHAVHDLESLVTFAALIVAPVLLGFALRHRAEWRDGAVLVCGGSRRADQRAGVFRALLWQRWQRGQRPH